MNDANAPHARTPKLGVLLVNLGSPAEPSTRAIRRYLAEFLSDRRVIELPRVLWWLILHLFVLPFRPGRIAENYRRIWTERGSPLAVHTADLAEAVGTRMQHAHPDDRIVVDWAMRYGQPNVAQRLNTLRAAGAERLLILPMYPQYSAATTGTVFDAATQALQQWRWIGDTRFVHQYHDATAYIDALADSLRTHLQAHAGAADAPIVMSFHGLPERYVEAGDPYFCHCHKTARLLTEALQLPQERVRVSFQSQFGKAKWVGPSTTATVEALAKQGHSVVHVICPGFAADCIETLDEIINENGDAFRAAGGDTLHYVPALNASPAHVDMVCALIEQHGQGWPELAGDAAQRDRLATPRLVDALQQQDTVAG